MKSYIPTKKEVELAKEWRNQIKHLTSRWHLGFTEAERETLVKALHWLEERYIVAKH